MAETRSGTGSRRNDSRTGTQNRNGSHGASKNQHRSNSPRYSDRYGANRPNPYTGYLPSGARADNLYHPESIDYAKAGRMVSDNVAVAEAEKRRAAAEADTARETRAVHSEAVQPEPAKEAEHVKEAERRTPARQRQPKKTEEQKQAERIEREKRMAEISRSVAAKTVAETLSDTITEAARPGLEAERAAVKPGSNIRIGENGQPEVELPIINEDGSVKNIWMPVQVPENSHVMDTKLKLTGRGGKKERSIDEELEQFAADDRRSADSKFSAVSRKISEKAERAAENVRKAEEAKKAEQKMLEAEKERLEAEAAAKAEKARAAAEKAKKEAAEAEARRKHREAENAAKAAAGAAAVEILNAEADKAGVPDDDDDDDILQVTGEEGVFLLDDPDLLSGAPDDGDDKDGVNDADDTDAAVPAVTVTDDDDDDNDDDDADDEYGSIDDNNDDGDDDDDDDDEEDDDEDEEDDDDDEEDDDDDIDEDEEEDEEEDEDEEEEEDEDEDEEEEDEDDGDEEEDEDEEEPEPVKAEPEKRPERPAQTGGAEQRRRPGQPPAKTPQQRPQGQPKPPARRQPGDQQKRHMGLDSHADGGPANSRVSSRYLLPSYTRAVSREQDDSLFIRRERPESQTAVFDLPEGLKLPAYINDDEFLDQWLNEGDDMTSAERRRKRRASAMIGALVTLFAAIGFIIVLKYTLGAVTNLGQRTNVEDEYKAAVTPVVMSEVPAFEKWDTIPKDKLLQSAIFNILLDMEENEYDLDDTNKIKIPSTDVIKSARRLYGDEVNIDSEALTALDGEDVYYSDTDDSFHIAATGINGPQFAIVKQSKRADTVSLRLGYLEETANPDSTDYYQELVFVLEPDEDNYRITAIRIPEAD